MPSTLSRPRVSRGSITLALGGASAIALVEEFGTPLMVLDEAEVRRRADEAFAAYCKLVIVPQRAMGLFGQYMATIVETDY